MNHQLITIAVLGALAGGASAQSSTGLYGIVDAGVVREQGGAAGDVTKISSGIASASRLGFRGSEDLARLSVVYLLEAGFRVDTGSEESSGSIFNRQAYVGLQGAAGTLTIGRQHTLYYQALSEVADPFGGGYAGSARNLFPNSGMDIRTSNTIVYASPVVNGFSGALSYSLGEQAGSSTGGDQLGAALSYSAGSLNTRLVYQRRHKDAGAITGEEDWLGHFAANYNFGAFTGFLAYGRNKGPSGNSFASIDARDMLIGVQLPFGAYALMASFIRKDDRSALKQDADQWALGLTRSLTSRTSLYTSYGRIRNKNGASYTVGNDSDTGSGDTAFNAGIRHSF